MSRRTPIIQLLQAEIDELDESHFRFLVDGKAVKYVTTAAGFSAPEDLSFAPTLLLLLPDFPPGDWNEGHVARSASSGEAFFTRTVKTQLPMIRSDWHSTRVDHLELAFGLKLRTGVYEAISSKFEIPIVVKFARFAWELDAVDDECTAYQWIDGQSIGPRFFGLLVEEGRNIGFMIENVTDAHHATPDDLTLCQLTLSRLHSLGILHGDVNRHNFLIRDGRAILIDFECARLTEDRSAFEEEMRRLPEELAATSGKGGSVMM